MTVPHETQTAPSKPAMPTAAAPKPAPKKRKSRLGLLALTTAVVSLGLHFLPLATGQDVTRLVSDLRNDPVSAVTASASPDLGTLQRQIADMQQKVDGLESALNQKAEEQGSALATTLETTRTELRDELSAIETRLQQHDKQLAMTVQPQPLSLLIARTALMSANRSLTADDIRSLEMLAAFDPKLAENVATLKVLVEKQIYPLDVLRDQFLSMSAEALMAARKAQMEWWESGLSSAHSKMADWGIAGPAQKQKDDLAVEAARRDLELGNIGGALLQIEAASPELKTALAPWMDQANLRLDFDTALQGLVDTIVGRATGPVTPKSGG